MNEINYLESLSLENPLYIDVRSPGEFADDHIPGAVNIPIFDNDERKEIGTLYKMTGKDRAIVRGTEIAGGKLSHIVSDIRQYRDRSLVIYCARGGMRSGSVTSLLISLGMKVRRLDQGYKGYRRHVREALTSLTIEKPVFIIQGLTGTGKSEILAHIPESLDLEGMAGHRSSLFGAIGLEQSSQKKFESLILHRLNELTDAPFIAIEGESRKIGNLHIPDALFSLMRRSPAVLITAPMERRAEIIVNEYGPDCTADVVIPIVHSLNRKLGRETIAALEEMFLAGNLIDFTSLLLEKYYDPLYQHSLKRFEYLGEVENFKSIEAAEKVRNILQDQVAPGE